MSSSSLPSSEQGDHSEGVGAPSSDVIDGDDDDDEEFYEAEPLPILGRCKALYPFEGIKITSTQFGREIISLQQGCLEIHPD